MIIIRLYLYHTNLIYIMQSITQRNNKYALENISLTCNLIESKNHYNLQNVIQLISSPVQSMLEITLSRS